MCLVPVLVPRNSQTCKQKGTDLEPGELGLNPALRLGAVRPSAPLRVVVTAALKSGNAAGSSKISSSS